MTSIFTKIINNEIPSTKIYEDDICLAFLDIHPAAKGHTLLVPKDEHIWMKDTPNDIISHLFIKAKDIMQTMIDTLWCDFVRLYIEWTEVPHFHIHLIPSMIGDNTITLWSTMYNAGETDTIAQKLRTEKPKN